MVEPHSLAQAPRYGALVLVAWVEEGQGAPGWRIFRYCLIRNLEILDGGFNPRSNAPDVWTVKGRQGGNGTG